VFVWTEVDTGYVKVISDAWAFKKRKTPEELFSFGPPSYQHPA